jgi:hypothetical protein
LRQRQLKQLLAAVYDQFQKAEDRKVNGRWRRNFVFHMTDWSHDLSALARLYEHPGQFDKEQAGKIVAAFLYHAIPHLKAAGRLMLDYCPEDFFQEVDSTKG